MARKVFQDFAHVLCQRFIELPSNRDLVNLVIFGSGTLKLNFVSQRAWWNRCPVSPIPYSGTARDWLQAQMAKRKIPTEQLTDATLTVKYAVEILRRNDVPYPEAAFDFECIAAVASPDRSYTAAMDARKRWGLSGV